MHINKKSQMEIMGLAVIVILIVVGFAFMIRFKLQEKPSTVQEDYSKSTLASTIVNTLRMATVTSVSGCNCAGMSFSEMLEKCYEDDSSFECTGCDLSETDPCKISESEIKKILDGTVGEDMLGWEYYFTVKKSDEYDVITPIRNLDPPSTSGCPGKQVSGPYTFPVNGGSDTMEIRLDICG